MDTAAKILLQFCSLLPQGVEGHQLDKEGSGVTNRGQAGSADPAPVYSPAPTPRTHRGASSVYAKPWDTGGSSVPSQHLLPIGPGGCLHMAPLEAKHICTVFLGFPGEGT